MQQSIKNPSKQRLFHGRPALSGCEARIQLFDSDVRQLVRWQIGRAQSDNISGNAHFAFYGRRQMETGLYRALPAECPLVSAQPAS